MYGLKPVPFAGKRINARVEARSLFTGVIPGGGLFDMCDANELAARVHSRMPVILDEGRYAKWLDPEASPREVLPLLRPFDAEDMKMWAPSLAFAMEWLRTCAGWPCSRSGAGKV